jgi:hypothetical protein
MSSARGEHRARPPRLGEHAVQRLDQGHALVTEDGDAGEDALEGFFDRITPPFYPGGGREPAQRP